MRRFGTQGPVNPQEHYVVSRSDEIADYIKRVDEGRYVVLFAPRQTGKTTFFQDALAALIARSTSVEQTIDYFPIQLNFDVCKNLTLSAFYEYLYEQMREDIEAVFQGRGCVPSEALRGFLEGTTLTNHLSMMRFFKQFTRSGKKQLAAYLISEGVTEGDYIVFDHRQDPEPRVETETIEGLTIRSYIIPVMQEAPSKPQNTVGSQ